MTASEWMIDADDAVLLLIDHQSGLFQLVRDIEYTELRNNVITLAKVAKIAKIPTITTASVPDGPNGPILPEIHQSNPDAVHFPRQGRSTPGITAPLSKPSKTRSARHCSSPAR